MDRDVQLDAVRGLAAFSVLLYHSWLILPEPWHFIDLSLLPGEFLSPGFLLKFTPLHLLVAGPSCVALFFVLSGYVLSISMAASKSFHYGRFFIRRVCRIYLPFAAAILGAAVAYVLVSPGPVENASAWLTSDQWSAIPDARLILGHLLMLGTMDFQSLDPPMWSLVIEMRISIIFPALYFVMIRWPRIGLVASVVIYTAASIFMQVIGESVPISLIGSVAFTFEFLPFFVLGILMFIVRDWIATLYATSPPNLRRSALLVGVMLLGFPSIGPQTTISAVLKAIWLIAVSLGSIATIILALHSHVAGRVLRQTWAQWLGKVSYSLYLTHMLVLFTAIHSLDNDMPLPAILGLAFPTCLLVAGIVHRLIELPAMRLGYVLTSRPPDLARKPHAASGLGRVSEAQTTLIK